jgi:protein-tyrosine phosphatase
MLISPASPRILVTETEPVLTRRNPESPHNFGPISTRDQTLFTAERPGHPGMNGVPTRIVEEWVEYILSKGIKNVLIIMDDNEFGVYEVDLKAFYEKAGLKVYHIPFSPISHSQTMALIEELDSKGEKIVSHCTGGKGRCGRVA